MVHNWLNLASLLSLFAIITSCKNEGSKSSLQEEKKNEIVALFASNDPYERVRQLVGTQIFKVKLEQTEFLVGKKGTVLQVEPNSFVYEDGTPVKGEVEIELGEIMTMSDFIKSGISTLSDGKMLTSGGTFFIEAKQGDKKLKINPKTGMRLIIPAIRKEKDMKLFDGELTPNSPNGSINWKLAEKPNPVFDANNLQKITEDLEKYGKTTDKDLLAKKYEDFKLFMLMIRDFTLEGEWYYNKVRYDNAEKAGADAIHKSSVDTIKMFIKAYEQYIQSSAQNQQLMLKKNQYLKKGLEQYKNFLKNKPKADIMTFHLLDSLDRYYRSQNTTKQPTVSEQIEFIIFENYSNYYNCDRLRDDNVQITYRINFKNIPKSDNYFKLHLVSDFLNYHRVYKVYPESLNDFTIEFPNKIPFGLLIVKNDGIVLNKNYHEEAMANGNEKEIEFLYE